MRKCALRPSGYDFTTLYTIGGYSRQTHSGVSSRVLSPTLTCRVQDLPANDIGSARQGNRTPEFEVSVLASSFLLPSVSGCLLSLCLSNTIWVGTFRTLVKFFYLRHVLNDGACGNVAGAHGSQLTGEAWEGHGGELVQHEVDVAGQGPVVDLVGAVVEGLERLGVKQAHQKVKRLVIIRYDSVQRTLLLSQSVEVHVIPVGDGFDLRQVEGGQPDGSGHED